MNNVTYIRRLVLIAFVVSTERVRSRCHLVHTYIIICIVAVKGAAGLLHGGLLILLILLWKCYVLLTDLHLFGRTFVQASGSPGTCSGIATALTVIRVVAPNDVAIIPLDWLAVRFGRLWDRVGTFGGSWMAGRPRWCPTTTLLLREGLRLAWAHNVLWDIDQVSLPVFLHRSTQLLRGASVRCILIRTVNLPATWSNFTYVGADYWALSWVVIH